MTPRFEILQTVLKMNDRSELECPGEFSFLSLNRLPGSLPPFRSEAAANAKTVHIPLPRPGGAHSVKTASMDRC